MDRPPYKKMYAVLCAVIDEEIDTLKRIPLAFPSAKRLAAALQKAEEIFIETTTHVEETDDEKVIVFHRPEDGER